MSKIAFILLCHKDPEAIVMHARRLTAAGDYMVIHFDANASEQDYQRIQSELKGHANVAFAQKRAKCGWGEWSLVQGTLNALSTALDVFADATHFYMLSGDCMPIKPAAYIHKYLDEHDADFIESFDFFTSDWIKTGMKEDRLIYRHFLNERAQKSLFYLCLNIQRRLGIKQKIPKGLQMRIGSQWWCLRRRTVEALVNFIKARQDILRFFKWTWIPDETFFQTLVYHLIPQNEIQSRTLTFLLFSDYGMPITFYDDQYDLLLAQDYLFARKISPEASSLRRRLGLLYASEDVEIDISNEGARLLKFLSGRGRVGRRFASRFWEKESSLGRERTLFVLVCKKWQVAKRLLADIESRENLPCLGYMFHENDAGLPEMGGLENSIEKRSRHRRVFMRMLFDYFKSNRMVICLDPSSFDLLQDFAADRSTTKVLEIKCEYSDDYLIGHAKRLGLAGEQTSWSTFLRLLPSIRNDINFESDRIEDANFTHLYELSERGDPDANAQALMGFLGVSQDEAQEILNNEDLFKD